jgi:AraC-like DNA-binding protein
MSLRPVRLKPRPVLAQFVRHIRMVPAQRAHAPYVRLPDGELELVIRLADAGPALHAIGTRISPLHKEGYERERAYAVRFKAGGAYPFFGVPVSELTDGVVAVERLWGDDSLRLGDALRAQRDPALHVAAIEDALCARLSSSHIYEPSYASSVRRAIRLLHDNDQLPSVEQLAERLGSSARQLRRGFAAVAGLGPKEYLRVLRFQRALRWARTDQSASWGSIAVRCGYYDQAHMIAEFQLLAGRAPGALRKAAQPMLAI